MKNESYIKMDANTLIQNATKVINITRDKISEIEEKYEKRLVDYRAAKKAQSWLIRKMFDDHGTGEDRILCYRDDAVNKQRVVINKAIALSDMALSAEGGIVYLSFSDYRFLTRS